jgi:hypothetical protein
MAGSITFGPAGATRQSSNTKAEFSREAVYEDVERALRKLSTAQSLRDGRVCFVFGMGKQSKQTYLALGGLEGAEVVFSRTVLPWYLSFLQFLTASYEGLVRIEDFSVLPDVALNLVDHSMVGVYIADRQFENELIRQASTRSASDDLGIKSDPAYSLYTIDADNTESHTGIIEIISYGIETPADLIPA